MNFKKLVASVAAGATALSMTAISAFAQTIELDSEYPGAWGASTCISKADLQAIGGDVKITLTVTPKTLIPDQIVLKPMDYDNSWTAVTDYLTSDTAIRKPDGFIYVTQSQTEVEFVIPADCIETLGESGLSFQVNNVTVNSAEIEAGAPEAEMRILGDEFKVAYCMEESTYEELTAGAADESAEETEAPAEEEAAEEETEEAAEEEAPAEEEEASEEAPAEETEAAPAEEPVSDDTETPASDSATTPAATGNTAAGALAAVMAISAAAAVTVKKIK